MANTKSAKKNAKKAERRHKARVMVKSELKTRRKKVFEAIKAGKPLDEIKKLMIEAVSKFDKAASNKYIHRKTASRKISRLMKAVHKALQERAANTQQTTTSAQPNA